MTDPDKILAEAQRIIDGERDEKLRAKLDRLVAAASKHCDATLETAALRREFNDQVTFMKLCAAIEEARKP